MAHKDFGLFSCSGEQVTSLLEQYLFLMQKVPAENFSA